MEVCFHCGDHCDKVLINHQQKTFCCHGCKTVFDILNDNDLTFYYDLEQTPGITPKRFEGKFDFLENEAIANKLLSFNEQDIQVVQFTIPSIHCSSCIWILENLNKLNSAVKTTQVNFPKKTLRITFNSQEINLYNLVQLLCRIGYEPMISLEDSDKKKTAIDRSLIYKLGVAGFAFGNIMFLSFPEYFEVNEFWLERYKHVFRWLMFVFALPVVVYSAQDYFISAFKGLRSKILNIDVPIAIGIAVLFIRSTIEVYMDWGTGFFDSMAGLVFFLLLGKFFQQKTYSFLSFERDYKSYFPIAVTKLSSTKINGHPSIKKEEQTHVNELNKGDRILIRNGELIPVDAILTKGTAYIDYSFVTGEAVPIFKKSGDQIFAGGRQEGSVIELEVINSVKQSYLTQLWSNKVFDSNRQNTFQTLTDKISKHFTITILSIALVTTIFWLFYDPSLALNVFTAVLIVACPCAIALAAPFTLGNLLRIYGRNKLYLKNSEVIEQMAQIDTIVFDKTGTLTTNEKSTISYTGDGLNTKESSLLKATLQASNHPLSRTLYTILKENDICTLDDFEEEIGKGIVGKWEDRKVKIGSHDFVMATSNSSTDVLEKENTSVYISVDDAYRGKFILTNEYRSGIEDVFNALSQDYQLIILSGDNEGEKEYLSRLLPPNTQLLFDQKPEDKLHFIKSLQEENKNVMMVGDGLNDSGALAQSDVGIAISENINVFSPACDGILDAERFKSLVNMMRLSKKGIQIIKYAFIFSLLYNLIGLGFAVTGYLTPIVAAILMPLSSISIVIFVTLTSHYQGNKLL
ncbi:heavy metal translocating P-type ATPase [Spongiivirga citrea]|uniref:Heavy metal translocating P-type ATPase n=1 Tax=Spongiivirga citrea TaxID=1481457 RepID=A0A6M0CVG6_9FLAO|nr:heavy metal translocating P-type ATPase metal-binding domain-containing protein [Spongiivirga citrea]NER17770.1 heavy metal translocating P-type ATPase [Spongiivirga citrea]